MDEAWGFLLTHPFLPLSPAAIHKNIYICPLLHTSLWCCECYTWQIFWHKNKYQIIFVENMNELRWSRWQFVSFNFILNLIKFVNTFTSIEVELYYRITYFLCISILVTEMRPVHVLITVTTRFVIILHLFHYYMYVLHRNKYVCLSEEPLDMDIYGARNQVN